MNTFKSSFTPLNRGTEREYKKAPNYYGITFQTIIEISGRSKQRDEIFFDIQILENSDLCSKILHEDRKKLRKEARRRRKNI